jgi:predicted RNA binding protein YcfA (HicA-like mRNA interferase family)
VNFRDFIRILEAHGFELKRTAGSHRRYEGIVGGRIQLVTVAYHSAGDEIRPKTLASMIYNQDFQRDFSGRDKIGSSRWRTPPLGPDFRLRERAANLRRR